MESKSDDKFAGNARPSPYSQAASAQSADLRSLPPREGKRSYSQAAARTTSNPFFRKVYSSIGVVETIHRTKTNAYARITVGRGDELSIKVSRDTDLRPGAFLQITDAKVDGKTEPRIFGVHRGPVNAEDHPLCLGHVRWFDRKQRSWIVKVRSSRAYLKVQTSDTALMRNQTIIFIPKFPNGRIQVDRIVQYQGGVPTGVPPT